MKKDPVSLSRAHVGKGIFLPRVRPNGEDESYAARDPTGLRGDGRRLRGARRARRPRPGVWLTGPVPRVHDERNWSPAGRSPRRPSGLVEDTVPEDQSLVVDTDRGLVVISGCGHAGIVNTVDFARRTVRPAPMHALVGGFHLFAADDAKLDWTADRLRESGVENFVGAHCTGIEAVYRLRGSWASPGPPPSWARWARPSSWARASTPGRSRVRPLAQLAPGRVRFPPIS